MQVTVELQTYLEQYSPNGQSLFECTLPEGATAPTLVRQLTVPEELASVIVINDNFFLTEQTSNDNSNLV